MLENLPLDDPALCSYPPPSFPLRAARSAVTPVYRPYPCPLTHPSGSPVGDGQGRVQGSQARSEVWPHSHYPGLAPCHYFKLFPPPFPPINLSPALREVQYIPHPQACFITAFKPLHLNSILQKVVLRVKRELNFLFGHPQSKGYSLIKQLLQ